MKQINTQAIILNRTDYGEADRILTLLTPDNGKLSLMAKGVRRIKSKLAGGIELFSVSDITYIRGRGEVGTLVSTRLLKHYDGITKDIQRTMLGYDLIKRLNKATEDEPEAEYFELLQQVFTALDDRGVGLELIRLWFQMQLLRLGGHTPNLQTDVAGNKLQPDLRYDFSFDDMTMVDRADGRYGADDIKFLRVGFSGNQPATIQKIAGHQQLLEHITPLVRTMLQSYVQV